MRRFSGRQRVARLCLSAVLLTTLTAACGDGDEGTAPADSGPMAAEPDPGTVPGGSSTEVAPTRATGDTGDTGDGAEPTSPEEAADAGGLVIDVFVAGDVVEVESTRFDVPLGSTVTIVVEADRDEDVHLHGYDILAEVTPDEPATIVFDADVPGVFEVELERSATFLFEVAVSG